MFKTIVWSTDGSDGADQALPAVKELAQQSGARVVAIHCTEIMIGGKGGGGRMTRYPNESELRAKIDGQVRELSDAGVPTSLIVTTTAMGGAAPAIADAAREQHADLIVAGSRGHTILGGLFLGSVTQRLLHVARCPVLVVPTEDRVPTADREDPD